MPFNCRMQLNHDTLHSEDSKPIWALLVEIPLSKIILNEDRSVDPSSGQLSDWLRDVNIPPETLCFCNTTLINIARKAVEDNREGKSRFPVKFRLFSKRKSLIPNHGNGAWGFYVIEKAGEDPDPLRQFSGRVVELYFYREEK
jgi:hypothetical protein